MSRRPLAVGASLALVLSGLTLLASPAAVAAAPSGGELAAALDAPGGVTASLSGDPLAASVTDVAFNDFPSRGVGPAPQYAPLGNNTYVVLSTGKASDVFSPSVPNNQPSTDLGSPGPDVTTLSLDVVSNATPRCLLIDFSMGTEERVHTYTTDTPSDSLSVTRAGAGLDERAVNAGGAYIVQEGMNPETVSPPVPYTVNAIDYWHTPGDPTDPQHGTAESPRLPKVSAINSFTSRDTAEVPLAAGAAHTVNVTVKDAGNGSLDSVALIDRVRFAPSCSFAAEGMSPDTGVATGTGSIEGHRGVGNVLTLDPDASTTTIEKYDAPYDAVHDRPGNGWLPAPVELRFRWYRSRFVGASAKCYSTALGDWVALSDGDRQSYVPTNLEKNYCLMVLVTGTKDGFRSETFPTAGQGWYVTLPIQEGIFDGQRPVIACDQTPSVGSKLTASIVDFVPRPDSYEYQWLAGATASSAGTPISGATGKDVTLTAAESGKWITVRVTGERSGFDSMAMTSLPCGPVRLQSMTSTPRPIIQGTGEQGAALSVSTGTWQPAPSSFGYQWRLNGQVIAGATSSSYTPKPTDVGQQVTVAVTGGASGYQPVTQVSDPITVGVGQLTSGVPYVSGTAVVNGRLTGTTTGWSSGASLTFIWSAAGQVLQEGVSRTFTVPAGAAGRSVTLTVRGSKDGYGTVERSSAPTAPVANATMSSGTPRISGRLKVGKTVRVTASGWTPGVTLTYRWMVKGKFVGKTTTKPTLKIAKSWKGKRISVLVTGTATGYTTVARKSASSAKVTK